jgi:hypothetical protein
MESCQPIKRLKDKKKEEKEMMMIKLYLIHITIYIYIYIKWFHFSMSFSWLVHRLHAQRRCWNWCALFVCIFLSDVCLNYGCKVQRRTNWHNMDLL